MLWEAVSGRRYWDGHEELTIYRRLLAGDLPSVGREHHVGHRVFADIFERALAVDPEKRYGTAGEMRAAIEGALLQMGTRTNPESVGRTVGELFERERVAFHTAVRAELLRLKAGKQGPSIAVLNNSPASLTPKTEVIGLRSPTNPSTPAVTTDDIHIDLRPKLGWLLASAWVSIGILLGLAAWFVVRRGTFEADGARPASRPPEIAAVAPERPTAARVKARAEASNNATEPPARADVEGSPTDTAKPRAAMAPARPRPAPQRAAVPAAQPDEFKRAPRARRTLDQDDPWSE
jgi:hypothetical protein